MGHETSKGMERAAKLLAGGEATVAETASPDKVLLDGGEKGVIAILAADLAELSRRGLVERSGPRLRLTSDGAAFVRRLTARDPFQDQHRDIETVPVSLPDGVGLASVNMNESPLVQFFRRRTKTGAAYLTDREFRAGERLRSDYTRGNIMPRLGANWVASVASNRRGAGSNALIDLTDAALAARQRVENALKAVGPELAGVLVDVCCFLKGIETVEAERRWPARSAKLMLKTGLSVLSRHYEPATNATRQRMVHWGADGFRPTISS